MIKKCVDYERGIMEYRFEKIMKSFKEDFRSCLKSIDYIEQYAYHHEKDLYDEGYDFYSALLKYDLKSIYKKLTLMYDALGLEITCGILKQDYETYKKDLSSLTYYSEIGELGSEPYNMLNNYYDQLRLLLNID